MWAVRMPSGGLAVTPGVAQGGKTPGTPTYPECFLASRISPSRPCQACVKRESSPQTGKSSRSDASVVLAPGEPVRVFQRLRSLGVVGLVGHTNRCAPDQVIGGKDSSMVSEDAAPGEPVSDARVTF